MANKLQTLVYEAGSKNDLLYDEILGYLRDGVSVDTAFKSAKYNKRLKENIMGSVLGAMGEGTKGTIVEVDADKAEKWYLHTDHQGGELSPLLRSERAKKEIESAVKGHFKFKSSAQELARKLPTDQYGKLPKEAKELIDMYKGGSADVTSAINRLKRYNAKNGSVYLSNAYNDIARAIEKDDKKLLDKAVSRAMKKKVAYMNNRIARTETARAYNMSRNRAYEDDPAVIGWRWVLSPAHPRADVCDYCADSNAYGMGAGVYPVGDGPSIPAHPMCLCMSEPVKRMKGRSIGRYSQERDEEARQEMDKRGYNINRLNKDISRLSNNSMNKLPKSVVKTKASKDE